MFVTKDSTVRVALEGGMERDTADGKIDYTLVHDGPMFERWAQLLDRGARKYDKRNWMRGQGREVYDRFVESAYRHFVQWLRGDRDEDHAAAVLFNLNGAERLRPTLFPEDKEV